MAYLAEHRNQLKVSAKGCVEIRIDPDGGQTAFGDGVFLQCVPCGDELGEDPERSLFECGSCGYTMTRDEADELATEYVRALSRVFNIKQNKERRRGLLWLFTGWLRSRKERRALTS